MSQTIELNQGEVKVKFSEPTSGKISFKELGLNDKDLVFETGLIRMVFDFEGIGEHHYFAVPTIEISYQENMSETHWQVDFNENTILDKTDHHGHSTVILMDKKKLRGSEHHHQNSLIMHGEFPQPVHLIADKSFVNFFK